MTTVASAQKTAGKSLQEQATFQRLKQRLDAYARGHGLGKRVETIIERRGLVVRVLTDRLLFSLWRGDAAVGGIPVAGGRGGAAQCRPHSSDHDVAVQ